MLEVFADHERALLRSQSGPPLRRVTTLALTHSCSVFCFFVAFTCRCLLLLAFADVAVQTTRLAGSLREGGASQWRVRLPGSAAKQEVVSQPMSRSVTWIWQPPPLEMHDARRWSWTPLIGRAQVAADTTVVSVLHCDGSATTGAPHTDGIALVFARRRKERTYPELVGPRHRPRLVVWAGEVAGRWSHETQTFLRLLARARAGGETALMNRRVVVNVVLFRGEGVRCFLVRDASGKGNRWGGSSIS